MQIILPEIPSGFDSWTVSPVWIRAARTLHAIVWVYPTSLGERKFCYLTRKGLHRFDVADDDDKAVVLCETRDTIGVVHDVMDVSYVVCSKCARLLEEFKFDFWSPQVAAQHLAEMRQLAMERQCHTIDWALSQVDVSSQNTCTEMLDEIARRAPNHGTRLFSDGLLIGLPDVHETLTEPEVRRLQGAITAASKKTAPESTASGQAFEGLSLVHG